MRRLRLGRQPDPRILAVRRRRRVQRPAEFAIQMWHSLVEDMVYCLFVRLIDQFILRKRKAMALAEDIPLPDTSQLMLLLD